MTQIGLMFEGQYGLTWQRWQRLLKAAEDFGYQSVFRSDHYTIGQPYQESLEAWVSMTYAASHTQRIEFGTLVSPVTFRQPALLVRMAAAVDDLSGGRLVLGLGAGWHEAEHRQFGVPFYDKVTRHEMFAEGLEITTRLLRDDAPQTFTGKHFSLDGAVLLPRPQRPGGPPILIGGNGMKWTLPLVANYADEWNGVGIDPSGYKERNQHLTELLQQSGRDPKSVKRSVMTEVIFGVDDGAVKARLDTRPGVVADDPSRFIGTPSQITDKIGEYIEAGAERIMLQWMALDDVDGIENLAQTVLPQFHNS